MGDDQQFCLRWNNHQSTLVSVFDTLLESGTLVDCTLAAEGKSLKAHKVVLSACSPYFASVLEQQYDKHPIFILKDVKFQELRAMMDYMYRGEVNISQDQLSPLLKAAESLQIKGLSDNRSAGSPHKAQQQQTNDQHKQLSVPVATTSAGVGGGIKLPISSGYTLESKRIRHAGGIVGVGGGSASIDSQDLSGSREGSSSPTSRKRKKIRRRSVENIMAEAHEHSNSSSHSMQINSSAPTITSAAAAIASVSTNAATSSLSTSSTAAATLAGGNIIASAGGGLTVTKKTDSVSNAKLIGGNIERDIDNDEDNRDENGKSAVVQSANTIGGVKKEQNHKQRKLHHQHQDAGDASGKDNSELLIEPKNEYDDGNDETVEDLTLDDEELEDLEQAGPSHGGGEGSSQGYAQWQVDRSQDEIFIATQEAAGQQRDPQDLFWFNNTVMHSCEQCGKSYKTRKSLSRHRRFECRFTESRPLFQCPSCNYAAKRSDNLNKHIKTHYHKTSYNRLKMSHNNIMIKDELLLAAATAATTTTISSSSSSTTSPSSWQNNLII